VSPGLRVEFGCHGGLIADPGLVEMHIARAALQRVSHSPRYTGNRNTRLSTVTRTWQFEVAKGSAQVAKPYSSGLSCLERALLVISRDPTISANSTSEWLCSLCPGTTLLNVSFILLRIYRVSSEIWDIPPLNARTASLRRGPSAIAEMFPSDV
jgi:hypothetical protein